MAQGKNHRVRKTMCDFHGMISKFVGTRSSNVDDCGPENFHCEFSTRFHTRQSDFRGRNVETISRTRAFHRKTSFSVAHRVGGNENTNKSPPTPTNSAKKLSHFPLLFLALPRNYSNRGKCFILYFVINSKTRVKLNCQRKINHDFEFYRN
jgi:hypothetical protein